MKLITAVIQPFMVDKLAREIRKQNISGYTITETSGSGHDQPLSPDHMQKRARVEIAVNDNQVESIVRLVAETVGTHQAGDGFIYVTTIDSALNIHTGQKDELALSPS